MSKNTNEQCQFLFQGLLKGKWSATSYIRELQETIHCDQFYSFKEIRAEVREFIDAEAMDRILAYNETQQDERRAVQAICHIPFDKHLCDALDWKRKGGCSWKITSAIKRVYSNSNDQK